MGVFVCVRWVMFGCLEHLSVDCPLLSGLMLRDLMSANLISEFSVLEIPESVSDSQSTIKVIHFIFEEGRGIQAVLKRLRGCLLVIFFGQLSCQFTARANLRPTVSPILFS